MQTTAIMEAGQSFNDTVYYYVKDYQGNVRSVVREDGAVVESNEYYPYGGLFSAPPSVQPYKYGTQPLARRSGRCNVGRMPVATTKTTFGNELDRTHGLDWYDSKARFYDSVLLRTNSVDKKAGDYTWLSPYSWCAANPIRFTDPTGMYILGKDGKRVSYNTNTKSLSKNAPDDVKSIGNAMLKTSVGKTILIRMLKSSYPIKMNFGETHDAKYGKATTTIKIYTSPLKKTTRSIFKVEIILYKEQIQNHLSDDVMYSGKGLTKEELIGAIGTHEGEHATNPEANSTLNEGLPNAKSIAENLATAAEQQYIDEITKNKNNKKDDDDDEESKNKRDEKKD